MAGVRRDNPKVRQMKEIRSQLSEELATGNQPPLGDLVPAAIRAGRRAHRRRRAGTLSGSAAALATAAVLVAGWLQPAGPDVPVAAAAALPAAGSGTAAPAPGTVPTSPAALLVTLLHALPAGSRTGNYAGQPAAGPAPTVAQTYLTGPAGTGMIRARVYAADPARACTPSDGCSRDPRGQAVRIEHVDGNCIQHTVVRVTRADGTEVELDLSTCLAWDGKANLPGVLALTEDQAVAVAGDPAFSLVTTPQADAAAARQFPRLPALTS
jgi:hypothetical protein